jgi:hypothetical protein
MERMETERRRAASLKATKRDAFAHQKPVREAEPHAPVEGILQGDAPGRQ